MPCTQIKTQRISSSVTFCQIELKVSITSGGAGTGDSRLMERWRKRGRCPCCERIPRAKRVAEGDALAGVFVSECRLTRGWNGAARVRYREQLVASPRSFRQTAQAVSAIRRESPAPAPKQSAFDIISTNEQHDYRPLTSSIEQRQRLARENLSFRNATHRGERVERTASPCRDSQEI